MWTGDPGWTWLHGFENPVVQRKLALRMDRGMQSVRTIEEAWMWSYVEGVISDKLIYSCSLVVVIFEINVSERMWGSVVKWSNRWKNKQTKKNNPASVTRSRFLWWILLCFLGSNIHPEHLKAYCSYSKMETYLHFIGPYYNKTG